MILPLEVEVVFPPHNAHAIESARTRMPRTRNILFVAAACTFVGSHALVAPANRGPPSAAAAFLPRPLASAFAPLHMSDYSGDGNFDSSIEEISFKIFPDGRIEETVRGVKGESCHEVTEQINSMLGKVTESKPTEEMYESEVRISATVRERQMRSGGGVSSDASSDASSGASSGAGVWEGSSSW